MRPFFMPEFFLMRDRLAAIAPLLMLTIVLLALAAYWPGLHGGFLFDDFINLPALGDTGPVDNWPTFWRYITSGAADPTGRPLTLLTFLLDARDWPADPYSFKRTNLILHLLNGVLLYTLLAQLGRILKLGVRRCQMAAWIGTALWLLHPLLVSTTLYIVQREAMLPATCVMTGLLLWLHGRTRLAAGQLVTGLGWSTLGLVGFTVLGVLTKANGVLLPLYALLIEIIVLAPRQPLPSGKPQRVNRAIVLSLMALPAIAICTYLTWIGLHGIVAGGPKFRTWTYAERLLTEPRVLMDYLALLWLPRPFSGGLFNDHYIASTSLLHPATTLPAILALFTLLIGAWWLRRKHPALALSVLFYFAGQVLESTSIPLELYFEHRNYVPALLMFWPLGLWLADNRQLSMLKHIMIVVLPIGLALMTHSRAEVWGNSQTQALIWARINPDSARAQANAAQIEMQAGQPEAAVSRLETLLVAQPEQVQLAFNLIGARCMIGGVSTHDIDRSRKAMLRTPNVGGLFAHWLDRILPVALDGSCPGLTPETLQTLINAGLQNPKLAQVGPRQDLTYMRGRIALAQGKPDAALADFVFALDLQPRPGMALKAAATLGAAGYPMHGLKLLDHYDQLPVKALPFKLNMGTLHDRVLTYQHYWPNELVHLRHQLILDTRSNNPNTEYPHQDRSTLH